MNYPVEINFHQLEVVPAHNQPVTLLHLQFNPRWARTAQLATMRTPCSQPANQRGHIRTGLLCRHNHRSVAAQCPDTHHRCADAEEFKRPKPHHSRRPLR
ncbi:hypothetical protein M0R45_001790 [Rubus argutus]|uniref:Uncharacterized protein n=1 Tax=Rubus argutus TaxID=59490 RepID=A0AAW1VLE3_RUBAR